METLLQMIEAQIDSSHSMDRRIELYCERAIYLTRLGRVAESVNELNRIRALFENGAPPRITIQLQILEGLIGYFDAGDLAGIDRINRAVALSSAIGALDLLCVASSWQAHLAFNKGDIQLTGIALRQCIRNCAEAPLPAKARLCLMLADIHQVAGKWKDASKWYMCARVHSQAARDRASLASIEFNRLGFGISRARAERVLSINSEFSEVERDWSLEAQSVAMLHSGLQDKSLPELLVLCQARTMQIVGQFEKSMQLLTQLRSPQALNVCRLNLVALEIEREWCKWMSGQEVDVSMLSADDLNSLQSLDLDDQVVILGMLNDLQEYIECPELEISRRNSIAIDGYAREINGIESEIALIRQEIAQSSEQTGLDVLTFLGYSK